MTPRDGVDRARARHQDLANELVERFAADVNTACANLGPSSRFRNRCRRKPVWRDNGRSEGFLEVSSFFSSLTRRRLQRGVFRSLVDLQATINRYLGEYSRKPKPFVWTADPDRIIEKLNHGYQKLASDHSHVRRFQ
jgi:hypothetical protein